MSEPEEITTMSGQKLQLKMSVDYISFSAHTDYQQTSEFIRALKPPHVVGLEELSRSRWNVSVPEIKSPLLRSWSTGSRMRWPASKPLSSGSMRTTTRFTSKSTTLAIRRPSLSTSEERNWPRSLKNPLFLSAPFWV